MNLPARPPSAPPGARRRLLLLGMVAALGFFVPATAFAQWPAFLQVGARLTWQAGGSSLEGSRMVPDPNGWIWQNGQWHRVEATYGGGGVGFTQLNVVGAGPDGIVGDVRNFLNVDLQQGVFVDGGSAVVVGDASALYPFWVSPARLAAMPEGFDGVTRVWRGPRAFGGSRYDTVSLATLTGGSYQSNTYDLATGLLLFGGSMDAQPGVLGTGPDGTVVQAGRGTVNVTHMLFAGARQLQLPWAGSPLPGWLAPGRSVNYQGQTRAELGGATGLPPLPGQALAVTFILDYALAGAVIGRQWTQVASGQGLPPDQVTSDRAFASAMFGGLYVPPDALARLQPNQVLDEDPFTGQRVYYGGVQGGFALVYVSGSGDALEQYYDPSSGLLTHSRYVKSAGGAGFQVNEVSFVGLQ